LDRLAGQDARIRRLFDKCRFHCKKKKERKKESLAIVVMWINLYANESEHAQLLLLPENVAILCMNNNQLAHS
jgi:hypothetical protein